MISRSPLMSLAVLVIVSSCGVTPIRSTRVPDPERPLNVVFILSDDQRADAMGAYGNPHIQTPNLDRLAASGLLFERAYCMGADQGAVCAPSRAMIMTGKGLHNIPGTPFAIDSEARMLPAVLHEAGYETFFSGKWHCGKDSFQRAFHNGDEIFFGGMGSHTDLQVYDYDPTGEYPGEARHPIGAFSSTAFVDAAIDFLREDDGSKPFFVHISLTAPHDPRTPPPEFLAMYPPAEIPLPDNFSPVHPFENGDMKTRDEKLAPWPRTPYEVRRHIAEYYGMISQLDQQVGRLMKVLKETGHDKDTLVVFTSDHGLAVGSHGLLGKQNLYEHSMRSPLVMAGPGVPEGKRTAAFAYLFDLYPTIFDMVGVEAPEGYDGRSLTDVFGGTPDDWRSEIFLSYRDVQKALRTDRYKLIEYPKVGETQLFDLSVDEAERNDLAEDPEYSKVLTQLRKKLLLAMKEAGDPMGDLSGN